MENYEKIRQPDKRTEKGGGGAGGGPRNLRKAKHAKWIFYGERPSFLSCTETLSIEFSIPQHCEIKRHKKRGIAIVTARGIDSFEKPRS